MPNPFFDSAQVLKKFSISWNLFDHIMRWNVHFNLPQHFQDAFLLRSLLLLLSAWGNGGGMLSFIESSLMNISSGSSPSCSLVFPTSLDTGCSISLPLLKVIMAWASSIFGAGSLRKLSSCTPLGLGQCLGGEPPFFLHLLLIV